MKKQLKVTPTHHSQVVEWGDLFYQGLPEEDITRHFKRALRSSFSLLVMNGKPVSPLFKSSQAGHAEEQLLCSEYWNEAVAKALYQVRKRPVGITIIVNRTPCHGHETGCSLLLSQSAVEVYRRLAIKDKNVPLRFNLLCTGVYETSGSLRNREGQGPTTKFDLARMMLAGWHIGALAFEGKVTTRGDILAQYAKKLERKLGGCGCEFALDEKGQQASIDLLARDLIKFFRYD
ncbi:MAG: hypothetical protein U0Y68_13470 [Blastocatellia bacterium]